MNIKRKLLVSFLCIGLIPLTILASIITFGGMQRFSELTRDWMGSIRDIRKAEIELFMANHLADLESLALVAGSYCEHDTGTCRIGDDTAPILQEAASLKDLDDLLLINGMGDVYFSSADGPELDTNLLRGRYRETHLAEAYRQAVQQQTTVLADFEPYRARDDAPTFFLVTPVLVQDELHAVMAVAMPLDDINKLLTVREGLGKTGETYLVSREGELRSEPMHGNIDRWNRENLINGGGKQEPIIAKAFAGQSGVEEAYDYRGVPVISAYTYLDFRNLRWALVATVEQAEQYERLRNITISVVSIGAITLVIIVLFTIVVAGRMIKPLRTLENRLRDIAEGDADLTKRLDETRTDEYGMVAKWFNLFLQKLQDMVKEIGEEAATINSSGHQLTANCAELNRNARSILATSSSSASATTQISDTIQGMAAAVDEMSMNASEVSTSADQMSQNMNTIASATEEISVTIHKVEKHTTRTAEVADEARNQSGDASETMRRLGESAKEIGKVTQLIQRIAEQTNLLALNATIEAATAGEAGKGFAVVADEVKALASQTSEATDEIVDRIEEVQSNTLIALRAIEELVDIVERMKQSADFVAAAVSQQSGAVQEIARNVSESNEGSRSIAIAISDIAATSAELAENILETSKAASTMDKGIQEVHRDLDQTTEAISQISVASEELLKISESLNEVAQAYKV
jgi:methyl-accepting chemotaxis protein